MNEAKLGWLLDPSEELPAYLELKPGDATTAGGYSVTDWLQQKLYIGNVNTEDEWKAAIMWDPDAALSGPA